MASLQSIIHFIKTWIRGYSRDHLRVGLQAFIAFVLVAGIISPLAVWEALSYTTVVPALALVFMAQVCPTHVGGSTLGCVYLVGSILLGGGLATAASYAAYAANGCSFDTTPTKAIVFTAVLSTLLGVVNMLRWMKDSTAPFFLMVSVASMFAGGITTFHLDYVAGMAVFHALALGAIGAAAILLSSWFIVPVTAGQKYRHSFGCALSLLAAVVADAQEMILSPSDSEYRRINIDLTKGVAARVALQNARQHMTACRRLELPIRFELDLYHCPRVFPLSAFVKASVSVWQAMGTAILLIRPLAREELDLSLIQQPPIKDPLLNLTKCMQALLHTLNDVVCSRAPFSKADEAMASLDDAWRAFVFKCRDCLGAQQQEEEDEGEDGVGEGGFAVQLIAVMLYLFGTSLRALYACLPPALVSRDPEAVNIAAQRLNARPGWLRPTQVFSGKPGDPIPAVPFLAATGINGTTTSSNKEPNKVPYGTARSRQGAAYRLKKALGVRKVRPKTSKRMISGSSPVAILRIWRVPIVVILGIQYALAIAFALALATWQSFSRDILHGLGNVLCVTVALTWMPTIGDVTVRTLYRLIGMVAAAAWSYFLVSIAYLAGGLDWSGPGKFVIAAIFMSLWVAFSMMNQVRYTRYSYLWVVGGITVPVSVMTNIRTPFTPWGLVGYRLIAICIGICVVWGTLLVVLPVKVRSVAIANLVVAMNTMAESVELMPLHMAPMRGSENEDNVVIDVSPEVAMQPSATTLHTVHALSSALHEKSIGLAAQVTQAHINLVSTLPALQREYLVFTKPRHLHIADVAEVALASQVLNSMCIMVLTLKMQSSPLEEWKLPDIQYRNYCEISRLTGEALRTVACHLQGKKDISCALEAVENLEDTLYRQIVETASNVQGGLQGQEDKLPVAVGVLLYTSLGFAKQLRELLRAVAKAFPAGVEHDAEAAQDAAERVAADEGPEIMPEKVLAIFMGGWGRREAG